MSELQRLITEAEANSEHRAHLEFLLSDAERDATDILDALTELLKRSGITTRWLDSPEREVANDAWDAIAETDGEEAADDIYNLALAEHFQSIERVLHFTPREG